MGRERVDGKSVQIAGSGLVNRTARIGDTRQLNKVLIILASIFEHPLCHLR
jgi:hypothetical protein